MRCCSQHDSINHCCQLQLCPRLFCSHPTRQRQCLVPSHCLPGRGVLLGGRCPLICVDYTCGSLKPPQSRLVRSCWRSQAKVTRTLRWGQMRWRAGHLPASAVLQCNLLLQSSRSHTVVQRRKPPASLGRESKVRCLSKRASRKAWHALSKQAEVQAALLPLPNVAAARCRRPPPRCPLTARKKLPAAATRDALSLLPTCYSFHTDHAALSSTPLHRSRQGSHGMGQEER